MSREDSPAFSFHTTRWILNEPRLLVEIKMGTYKRRHPDLKPVVDQIISRYFPSNTGQYESAVNFIALHNDPAFAHLKMSMKVAIHLYTKADPRFYKCMNDVLYGCENGAPHPDLDMWGDFLYDFVQGMKLLREGPPGGPIPPKETKLVRIAWIPDAIFQQHYVVGNEVLCKGVCSAATSEQWQFMVIGKEPSKTPVVLEFDESACTTAADIRKLSVFQPPHDEDERSFPPFFRGEITEIVPETNPNTSEHFHRVHIKGLKIPGTRPEALRANEQLVLSMALMIGLHSDPQCAKKNRLLDSLRRIDIAMRAACREKSPDAVESMYMCIEQYLENKKGFKWAPYEGKGSSSPFFRIFRPDIVRPDEILEIDRLQHHEIQRRKVEMQNEQKTMVSKSMEIMRAFKVEVLNEVDPKLNDFGRLHEQMDSYFQAINAIRSTPAPDADLSGEDAINQSLAIEKPMMKGWVQMSIAVNIIGKIITGDTESMRVFESSFPVEDSADDIMLSDKEKLLEEPDATWACEDISPSASRYVVGNMELLRNILSRVVVILPIGDPDAGKSSLLRSLYSLDVIAGLGPDAATRALHLYPHTEWTGSGTVFIADPPGCGDTIYVRDDITWMLLSLACTKEFRDNFVVVVCTASGRQPSKHLGGIIEHLDKAGVPCEFVVTKVDISYDELVASEDQRYCARADGALDMEEKDQRKVMAKKIRQQDQARIPDRVSTSMIYACFGGWAADPPPGTRRQARSRPKSELVNKDEVKEFFDLMPPAELKSFIEAKVRGLGV